MAAWRQADAGELEAVMRPGLKMGPVGAGSQGNRLYWLKVVVCCAWPLVIPIVVYSRRFDRVSRLTLGSSGLERGLEAVVLRSFLATLVVSIGLSVWICWLVRRHRSDSFQEKPLIARVLGDVGLLLAFFVAPWLVVSTAARTISPEILGLWIDEGVLVRSIPCICAVLAGLSFTLATARRRGWNVERAE